MTADRCGFVHDVNAIPESGATCCWRPVVEGSERCVWHADTPGRSREALAAAAPEPRERIDGARLSGADLADVDWFTGRRFLGADFSDANLRGVDFSGADLRDATFDAASARGASFVGANVEGASFSRADIRGARFTDARLDQAQFSGSRIDRTTSFGERTIYERELFETADGVQRLELFEAATWTYRTLQRLAHESARRGQSERYNRLESDLRRRFAWQSGNHLGAVKAELSRVVMGYGNNPYRVLGWALFVIVACAALYPVTGGIQEGGTVVSYTVEQAAEEAAEQARYGDPSYLTEAFLKSLYFSVVTFATLGYGDIQPIGGTARAIAGVEAILGSLLMALLVVVLTRRVSERL